MKNTFNYKLKKPNQEEFYNIDIHNSNMDAIDDTLITLETKKEHLKTKERVDILEQNRAMKNGNNEENFDAKEINAEEIKIKTGLVYHTGRKPTKNDIGLSNVDNFPSSDKYDILDENGSKFVLQKAIKNFYDKFTSLTTRVKVVEKDKAFKNGNNKENFDAQEINAEEIKIKTGLVYHTGRKPTKSDVGLGNLLNLESSDKYNILDETGDKFILQKAIKNMYDKLMKEVYDSALLGEPVQTLCHDLPNNINYGWCDGGQLKKSDYPNLWARVENTINLASQKITSGELSYGVNYFGWYIGDSSEYFRKPNMNITGHILRPSLTRFAGSYQNESNKKHSHKIKIDDHIHKMKIPTGPNLGGQNWALNTLYNKLSGISGYIQISTQNDNHVHTASISEDEDGENEVKMKNIAVKFYCRLK